MSVYHHADYSVLRDRLVGEGYTLSHWSDHTEWWRAPHGGELGVELPDTDPYESVPVQFEWSVSTQELVNLRFPL